MSISGQSPFAAALEGALRSIGVSFETLAEYIEFTTVEQIDEWIADRSLPSARQLRTIVNILRDCQPPTDPAALERFHAARAEFARILDERGSRISPLARQFIGTPGRYMLGPYRQQFEAALAILPTR